MTKYVLVSCKVSSTDISSHGRVLDSHGNGITKAEPRLLTSRASSFMIVLDFIVE